MSASLIASVVMYWMQSLEGPIVLYTAILLCSLTLGLKDSSYEQLYKYCWW